MGRKIINIISVMTTLRDWHGNGHGYGNVNAFGLGGIDLHRCRARTETCYCQTFTDIAVSM